MTLSTSTSTLAVGASRTFNLSPGSALTLTTLPNCRVTVTETPNTVSASGVGGNASRVHNLQLPQTVTYGPYPMGGTVVVENASNSGGAVTWVRSDALVAESASGVVSLVDKDGNVIRYQKDRIGAVTPYRLAVYGDSRANVSATHLGAAVASATTMLGEKTAVQLCMLRGDMQICFNGGISGDTAANWASASRASSSQNVAAMLATNPDLCLVQYGINDLILGTASATILTNLKAFAAKVIGAGLPFIFESINTAAAASATYINGYSSSGGFGASAAAKLVEIAAVRSGMRTFLAQFPSNLAVYVDTSSVSDASDGYAKTDKTYYDGTHMSRLGCRAAAVLIDAAIARLFPRRVGTGLKLAYPNGMNFAMLTPTSGRAAQFSAIQADSGTMTATYEVGQDDDGNWFQQYNVTVTALASGYFACRCEVLPDWVGSGFFAMAAADVVQCSVDYMIDNGSGGAPIASNFTARQRIYYDDASNEFTQIASVAQPASTDYPAIAAAESGRCITPRQAVKAAMTSANMTVSTALQFMVYGVSTGSFRLRLYNPQWGKVA